MNTYSPEDGDNIVTRHDPDLRQQVGLSGHKEVEDIVKPAVLDILPDLFPRLQLQPFPIGNITLELVLSHDGHFGEVHTDDLDGRIKVSFAYYFHKQPKAFSGGDLLLYDTEVGDSALAGVSRLTQQPDRPRSNGWAVIHSIARMYSRRHPAH